MSRCSLFFFVGEIIMIVVLKVFSGVSDGWWYFVQVQYYNKFNIGYLGLFYGLFGEKMVVVIVDDCDIIMVVCFGKDIGNYSCVVQGIQIGFKKFLDLIGFLFLGGVFNLLEDFLVYNWQFVGCMWNLLVDGKNVDMVGFIVNNGIWEGCVVWRNFCDGRWCQNGGICVNRWNMYLCECLF